MANEHRTLCIVSVSDFAFALLRTHIAVCFVLLCVLCAMWRQYSDSTVMLCNKLCTTWKKSIGISIAYITHSYCEFKCHANDLFRFFLSNKFSKHCCSKMKLILFYDIFSSNIFIENFLCFFWAILEYNGPYYVQWIYDWLKAASNEKVYIEIVLRKIFYFAIEFKMFVKSVFLFQYSWRIFNQMTLESGATVIISLASKCNVILCGGDCSWSLDCWPFGEVGSCRLWMPRP